MEYQGLLELAQKQVHYFTILSFLFIQSFSVHNMYDMLMCLFKYDIKFNKCITVHLDETQAVTSISNQKLSHFAAVSAGPSTSKIGETFFL